jgi:hypothetical protein
LPPFVLTCRNVILRSLATKNLLVVCFERVKNIKQILHCVQDDSQCQPCRFSSSAGERKIMNHFVVPSYFFRMMWKEERRRTALEFARDAKRALLFSQQ